MPNAPETGWAITGQTERNSIGPDGRVQDVIRVSFRMPWGGDYTVDVPKLEYNAVNVKAAVADLAGRLAEVHRATG